MSSRPSTHAWKFHRIGGLDQVALTSGADLLALEQLDPKLWVALSCPVKGLELDERTLSLIDRDKDGRIRAPDILETIRWSATHLRDVGEILKGDDSLPLSALDESTSSGKAMLAAARVMLNARGAADATAVSLADVNHAAATFASRPLNNDGVVTAACTHDAAVQRAMADIIACVGSVTDRSGQPGVNRAKIDAFYTAAQEFIAWSERGRSSHVLTLGEATSDAATAVGAVRAKVDDYFARTRLAAFDPRAIAVLNRDENAFAALAALELTSGAAEIAALPLAHIAPNRPLPLLDAVNPAWAGALRTLHAAAVTPLFGSAVHELTETQWNELKTRVAPYEAWQAAKAGAAVEPLGLERARALVAGPERQALLDLIAQDEATAPELAAIEDLERLVRFRRDFCTLLRNFVNFTDFYSPDRLAVFQAGTLYLDSRSMELCVEVADPAAHSKLAALSQVYLAYCELKRAGSAPRRIAACITQGHGDYLRAGRNGIFFDRQGRDWDATISLIIENPISIRQAFWAPYKKVARFVEDQMTKFAAAKEKSADESLAAGVAGATAKPAAGTRTPFDIARFAGIFAAIGLALGAIGSALAAVATGFMGLTWWQMPLAIFGALLVVSGPSMLLAGLKLRQRTLGPILDANGWAINGRVHINIPFGATLTQRADLPKGAHRTLRDPYTDHGARRRRTLVVAAILLVLAATITARVLGTWPFESEPTPLPETPAQTPTAG
jgi:hypothetical protein